MKLDWHREYVGGLWDEIGRLQFEFLRARGLKPAHRLFDVACGSLRAGVHFIPYLNADRYFVHGRQGEVQHRWVHIGGHQTGRWVQHAVQVAGKAARAAGQFQNVVAWLEMVREMMPRHAAAAIRPIENG